MAYNKTNWIANQTLVSANNLNKMEQGIEEAHEMLEEVTNTDVDQKVQEAIEEAKEYADNKVAELVGSAPDTLDTLKELGDALGNDANFASTVTRQIGEKLGKNENAASATKLQTARKIKVDGAVTGEGTFDGTKDVAIKTDFTVYEYGSGDNIVNGEVWYRIAHTTINYTWTNCILKLNIICNDNGNVRDGIGTLLVYVRTGSDTASTTSRYIRFLSNNGIEQHRIALTNKYVENKGQVFELWFKSDTPQLKLHTILMQNKPSRPEQSGWIMCGKENPVSELPKSVVQSTNLPLTNKAPETLKDAKAYVDERLATLTQLLVAKGILEEELVTIPELEEDIEKEE